MKIGFDGKRAIFNMTGLGNYSRSLVQSLAKMFPDNEYFLYSPAFKDNPRLAFLASTDNLKVLTPGAPYSGFLGGLWRSYFVRGNLRRDGIDVFHGLSNELPFGIGNAKFARIVTIHDLIFLRYPQYYPWLDRTVYARKVRYACQVADAIVAVSQQTKNDMIEFLGVSPNKIEVIYQSCDVNFTRPVSEHEKSSVRSRYNLPSQYLLYVGSIEERKNLLGLVKAVKLLKKTHDPFLIAIGNGGGYKDEVMEFVRTNSMTDRVRIESKIEFSDFPAVYQMAQALIYPSFFEGFGIPIIEALWSKTPVITSRDGCFAEAGGPQSVYISPENPEEIASAIVRVLSDSSLRMRMIAGGITHVQKFRGDVVSQLMMNLYKSTVRKQSTQPS